MALIQCVLPRPKPASLLAACLKSTTVPAVSSWTKLGPTKESKHSLPTTPHLPAYERAETQRAKGTANFINNFLPAAPQGTPTEELPNRPSTLVLRLADTNWNEASLAGRS